MYITEEGIKSLEAGVVVVFRSLNVVCVLLSKLQSFRRVTSHLSSIGYVTDM